MGKQERTRCAIGSSPQWSETLTFPFQPPGNDYSSTNMSSISEGLYFTLFDEVQCLLLLFSSYVL